MKYIVDPVSLPAVCFMNYGETPSSHSHSCGHFKAGFTDVNKIRTDFNRNVSDLVLKPTLGSGFVLCNTCAVKNLKELAFQFRRDIPREELPG